MTRALRPLDPTLLRLLGEEGDPCTGCLYWQLDPVRRARVEQLDQPRQRAEWVREVTELWGPPGLAILVDDEPAGYALFAPPHLMPGAEGFPTSPASADAVVLAELWLSRHRRRQGLGKVLVQSMAAELIRRGVVAVEVFAAAHPGTLVPPCLIDAGYLERVGFREQRPHPVTPRLRMDLRSTLPTLERLTGAIGARPGRTAAGTLRPEPAAGLRTRNGPSTRSG